MDVKYEYKKRVDNILLSIAVKLPKRLLLWCFIVVYGEDGECPSLEYKYKADYWSNKYNIK